MIKYKKATISFKMENNYENIHVNRKYRREKRSGI